MGAALAGHVRSSDVIALIGELGAGKTQLVQGLAHGLGVAPESIASPTFVLVQEYHLPEAPPGSDRPVLVHIDAYRIASLEDLESIGWDSDRGDVLSEMRRGAVVVVEWADRIEGMLGTDLLELRLAHESETTRRIEVTAHGTWQGRFAVVEAALDKVVADAKPQAGDRVAKCPICTKPVEPGSAFVPFCSERCKLVDLGQWLGGNYVISRPVEEADLEEE